ncbi:hypothetical protein BJ973_005891 [Actinoplanes tereljensis]|uniref:Uncharacterized protein n=1 Tax=Paractinoplanes tereljensis TaxID=571912 RepID=A0A919TQZ2_9ACTN|nr:hypothetical protein [Actinoplanes tereljensis]GIF18846.1 hypothetical protein Ate02nite_15760 [Actinoplanes tereljensis]
MKRLRIIGTLLATLALTAGTLGVAAAPAYADDQCQFIHLSSGKITVKSNGVVVTSVPFGANLTVSWTQSIFCPSYTLMMVGPGFVEAEEVNTTSRANIWAIPPQGSNTMTWDMWVYAAISDNPGPYHITQTTIAVF